MKIKRNLALLILILILSSCRRTFAKTVYYDSFCEGKFYSIKEKKLNRKDFENIKRIRSNPEFKITFDKFAKVVAINEREFKECPKKD